MAEEKISEGSGHFGAVRLAQAQRLETSRLTLRAYTQGDFESFAELNADPLVRLHMGGAVGRGDAARLFQGFGSDGTFPGNAWAITLRETGAYIGHCWLVTSQETQDIELGLLIARSQWGQGFGTEVVAAMLGHAKADRCNPRVIATVDTDHRASIRVLEKAGMHFECEKQDEDGPYAVYSSA